MLTGITDTARDPCITVEEPTALHPAPDSVCSTPCEQGLDALCDESQHYLELSRVMRSLSEPTNASAVTSYPTADGGRTCV